MPEVDEKPLTRTHEVVLDAQVSVSDEVECAFMEEQLRNRLIAVMQEFGDVTVDHIEVSVKGFS